jgi:hypothetical protein
MSLGRPLGEDGLEQDVTDPFADPLIAGQLFQQRVVILAHLVLTVGVRILGIV